MIDKGEVAAIGGSAALDGDALVLALTRRFRTSVQDVAVGDRTYSILKPANADDLIREEDFVKDERLPYWADVWPSSIILAGKLLKLDGAGRTALELGCGVGLSTLAASSLATAGRHHHLFARSVTPVTPAAPFLPFHRVAWRSSSLVLPGK